MDAGKISIINRRMICNERLARKVNIYLQQVTLNNENISSCAFSVYFLGMQLIGLGEYFSVTVIRPQGNQFSGLRLLLLSFGRYHWDAA